MRDAIEDLRADVAYWTAEAPRAEAYSPGAGSVARHALEAARAELAAARRCGEAAAP